MTTHEFETLLAEALEVADEEGVIDDDTSMSINTFERAGILTDGAGLVVEFYTDEDEVVEFQVSIVRSR